MHSYNYLIKINILIVHYISVAEFTVIVTDDASMKTKTAFRHLPVLNEVTSCRVKVHEVVVRAFDGQSAKGMRAANKYY